MEKNIKNSYPTRYVILVVLLISVMLNSACQSTDEPLSNGFYYSARVIGQDTGQNIQNANVTIEVSSLAPLNEFTGSDGFARITIPSTHANKKGRLTVQAKGYKLHTQNIDLIPNSLSTIVQLEPISLEPTSTPTATKSITLTPSPSPSPDSTPSPTIPGEPTPVYREEAQQILRGYDTVHTLLEDWLFAIVDNQLTEDVLNGVFGSLVVIERSGDRIRSLTPPDECISVHEAMLEVADRYDKFAKSFQLYVDETMNENDKAAEEAQIEAIEEIPSAKEAIDRAKEELEKTCK